MPSSSNIYSLRNIIFEVTANTATNATQDTHTQAGVDMTLFKNDNQKVVAVYCNYK